MHALRDAPVAQGCALSDRQVHAGDVHILDHMHWCRKTSSPAQQTLAGDRFGTHQRRGQERQRQRVGEARGRRADDNYLFKTACSALLLSETACSASRTSEDWSLSLPMIGLTDFTPDVDMSRSSADNASPSFA